MLMIIAIGLGGILIFWSPTISSMASRFGPDVAARFLERGKTIPSTNEKLSRGTLERWMHSSAVNSVQAKAYACFVIPADIIYILVFSGFLLSASISLQQIIPPLSGWAYVVWVFPVCYAIADFVEDFLIIYLLLRPKRVQQALFIVMRCSTVVKIASASIALIQVFLLAGYAISSHPFLSGCSYAGLSPHCDLDVNLIQLSTAHGVLGLFVAAVVLVVFFFGLIAFFVGIAWLLRGHTEERLRHTEERLRHTEERLRHTEERLRHTEDDYAAIEVECCRQMEIANRLRPFVTLRVHKLGGP
jgi:hypothetical protein